MPICKIGNPSCKMGIPSFKIGMPSCKIGIPNCKIGMPSCKIGIPGCKIGMPSCKIFPFFCRLNLAYAEFHNFGVRKLSLNQTWLRFYKPCWILKFWGRTQRGYFSPLRNHSSPKTSGTFRFVL